MDFLAPLESGALIIPLGIEWIILLAVIALVLFMGPTKLPELARGIGKALGEFRRGKMEIEKEIQEGLRTEETTYGGGGAQKVVEISPRVTEAAKELGLDVLGRKERNLKMDIIRAIEQETDEKLESVARILGIQPKGLDADQLRDRIGEALGI